MAVLVDVRFPTEPFFMKSRARCDFRIALASADREKAGLDGPGRKWS